MKQNTFRHNLNKSVYIQGHSVSSTICKNTLQRSSIVSSMLYQVLSNHDSLAKRRMAQDQAQGLDLLERLYKHLQVPQPPQSWH